MSLAHLQAIHNYDEFNIYTELPAWLIKCYFWAEIGDQFYVTGKETNSQSINSQTTSQTTLDTNTDELVDVEGVLELINKNNKEWSEWEWRLTSNVAVIKGNLEKFKSLIRFGKPIMQQEASQNFNLPRQWHHNRPVSVRNYEQRYFKMKDLPLCIKDRYDRATNGEKFNVKINAEDITGIDNHSGELTMVRNQTGWEIWYPWTKETELQPNIQKFANNFMFGTPVLGLIEHEQNYMMWKTIVNNPNDEEEEQVNTIAGRVGTILSHTMNDNQYRLLEWLVDTNGVDRILVEDTITCNQEWKMPNNFYKTQQQQEVEEVEVEEVEAEIVEQEDGAFMPSLSSAVLVFNDTHSNSVNPRGYYLSHLVQISQNNYVLYGGIGVKRNDTRTADQLRQLLIINVSNPGNIELMNQTYKPGIDKGMSRAGGAVFNDPYKSGIFDVYGGQCVCSGIGDTLQTELRLILSSEQTPQYYNLTTSNNGDIGCRTNCAFCQTDFQRDGVPMYYVYGGMYNRDPRNTLDLNLAPNTNIWSRPARKFPNSDQGQNISIGWTATPIIPPQKIKAVANTKMIVWEQPNYDGTIVDSFCLLMGGSIGSSSDRVNNVLVPFEFIVFLRLKKDHIFADEHVGNAWEFIGSQTVRIQDEDCNHVPRLLLNPIVILCDLKNDFGNQNECSDSRLLLYSGFGKGVFVSDQLIMERTDKGEDGSNQGFCVNKDNNELTFNWVCGVDRGWQQYGQGVKTNRGILLTGGAGKDGMPFPSVVEVNLQNLQGNMPDMYRVAQEEVQQSKIKGRRKQKDTSNAVPIEAEAVEKKRGKLLTLRQCQYNLSKTDTIHFFRNLDTKVWLPIQLSTINKRNTTRLSLGLLLFTAYPVDNSFTECNLTREEFNIAVQKTKDLDISMAQTGRNHPLYTWLMDKVDAAIDQVDNIYKSNMVDGGWNKHMGQWQEGGNQGITQTAMNSIRNAEEVLEEEKRSKDAAAQIQAETERKEKEEKEKEEKDKAEKEKVEKERREAMKNDRNNNRPYCNNFHGPQLELESEGDDSADTKQSPLSVNGKYGANLHHVIHTNPTQFGWDRTNSCAAVVNCALCGTSVLLYKKGGAFCQSCADWEKTYPELPQNKLSTNDLVLNNLLQIYCKTCLQLPSSQATRERKRQKTLRWPMGVTVGDINAAEEGN